MLVLFNLAFFALAYPAGALSDRMSPKAILMAGMVVLVAADLVLAQPIGFVGLAIGVALWGAHMGLTQGIFARMIADRAPPELRATSFGAFYFASGIATLLASVAAGLIWDRDGASATFLTAAGIAAVAFTDGRMIGATLDRNGLRPARYLVTNDNVLIMASETGVLPVKPENVKFKGRLQPGRMLLVDLEQKRIIPDEEIKAKRKAAKAAKQADARARREQRSRARHSS